MAQTATKEFEKNPSESSYNLSLTRPAKRQISHQDLEKQREAYDKSNQTGLTFNIWYGKWSGGDYDNHKNHNDEPSKNRVNIKRDVGLTRANAQGSAYVCLFFARGYCPNGSDCTYLHSLPLNSSEQGRDIFGREKRSGYRDDMGGTGSIERVNRTLYVGRIIEEQQNVNSKSNNGDSQLRGWNRSMNINKLNPTEKVLFKHFSEFGEIDRIRILHSRGCGFVTFVREVDAQFAKEAMMYQSLNHNECINLRWATDDPNPSAQKRDFNQRQQEGIKAIQSNLSNEAIDAGKKLLMLEGNNSFDNVDGKRRRIEYLDNNNEEEELKNLFEENQKNWQEMELAELDRLDAEEQEIALQEIESLNKEIQAAKPVKSIVKSLVNYESESEEEDEDDGE